MDEPTDKYYLEPDEQYRRLMDKFSLYGGEIDLCFDPVKHVYTVSGVEVQSVTGILDIISKPALVYWAVNQACGYFQKMLKPGEALDEIQIKRLVEDAKWAHKRASSRAADIGTLAHEWMERFGAEAAIGSLDVQPMPVNKEARSACLAFIEWVKAHEVKFLHCEMKIYSRGYNYAGTCDADAIVDGERCIIDYKSSSGIYPEMGLQLAAYQHAREEEGYGPYQNRWIIRVPKDGNGFEAKAFPEYQRDLTAFLAAKELSEWKRAA